MPGPHKGAIQSFGCPRFRLERHLGRASMGVRSPRLLVSTTNLRYESTMERAEESKLLISEQFISLQGEGSRVGLPSHFIRVAGCNLRCAWCDSPESSWHAAGKFWRLSELVESCASGPRDVVLTGGEPLLFPALAELSVMLSQAGHHITVETAGSVWLPGLRCDLMSISPKLAHSAPHERDPKWVQRHEAARWAPQIVTRLMREYANWQLKFVVRWRERATLEADLNEIASMLTALHVQERDRERVHLMPECIEEDELPEAYTAIMPACIGGGFRLGERLHIHIFGHRRGT